MLKLKGLSELSFITASIALLFLINGIVLGSWATNIPVLKIKLDLTDWALGVLLLVMSFGAVLMMVITGYLCRRYGSHMIAKISALSFAGFAVLLFLTNEMVLVVLALLLFGASNGAMDISMNQQAVLLESKTRSSLMSRLHGCFSLGALIGAGSTYILAGYNVLPAHQNLLLLGLIFLAAIILFPFLIREEIQQKGQSLPRVRVLKHPRLMFLGFLSFLTMLSEGAVADWGAVFLVEYSGLEPYRAALGYTLFAFLMTIARFFGDFLSAKFGHRHLVTLSGILTVIGMSFVLADFGFISQLAGFGLLGLGLANLIPIIFSNAARHNGVPSAFGITLVSTCGYAGFLVGPAAIGAIAHQIELQSALLIVVISGLIVVLSRSLFKNRF